MLTREDEVLTLRDEQGALVYTGLASSVIAINRTAEGAVLLLDNGERVACSQPADQVAWTLFGVTRRKEDRRKGASK